MFQEIYFGATLVKLNAHFVISGLEKTCYPILIRTQISIKLTSVCLTGCFLCISCYNNFAQRQFHSQEQIEQSTASYEVQFI